MFYKTLIVFLFCLTTLFAQTKRVENLLEKVNQASTPQEKKQLIEKIKIELAKKNIKAREEANAIIKAKEKMPLKPFDVKGLDK